MRFDIITIFPEAFSYLNESILKRAQQKGLIKIRIHNLRDFTADKHKKVDDKPYGGGPGMVIKIEPLIKAVTSILRHPMSQTLIEISGHRMSKNSKFKKTKIVLFSPAGKQFDNKIAVNLARNYEHLILICGHYEGIDARLKSVLKNLKLKTLELSIGSYVLTGGELPAMVLIDVVSRHLPGVLGKKESLEEKRLGIGIPVYTRPEVFVWKKKEYRVPQVLVSGNHKEIARWRAGHRI
jgi:tRNA (guanine37-N1)-methyltransferase